MLESQPRTPADLTVPMALAVFVLAAIIVLVGVCGFVLSRAGAL